MFKDMVIIISLRNNVSYVKMLYNDKVLFCAIVQNRKLPVVHVNNYCYFYPLFQKYFYIVLRQRTAC